MGENGFRPRLYVNTRPILVTWVIIAVNVAMYLVTLFFQYVLGLGEGYSLLILGAKVNELIVAGQWWRLLTPVGLHSGIMHLACNCFATYVWGRYMERLLGRWRYIAVYLVGGVMGNLLSFALSSGWSVGASGAIFGLFGAILAFRLRDRELFDRLFGVQVLIVIGFNLVYGFTTAGIDNFGHLGGLVGGFVMGCALGGYRERFTGKNALYLALTAAFGAACLLVGMLRWGAFG